MVKMDFAVPVLPDQSVGGAFDLSHRYSQAFGYAFGKYSLPTAQIAI